MTLQENESLRLPFLIGSALVIMLGLHELSSLMTRMWPAANAATTPLIVDAHNVKKPPTLIAEVQLPMTGGGGTLSSRCAECGFVASTREMEKYGDGSYVHTDGGRDRNKRSAGEEKSTKTYEITVRMKDGSSRVFMDSNASNWHPGSRVVVIDALNQK